MILLKKTYMKIVEKAQHKYKELPVALKATFWFTVCSFVQRGMSIITTPLFTRLMSTDEYGLYSTYTAWENVLFMIVSLSLYKSLMNLYVKHDDYKMVLSAICGIELLVTGICLVAGVIFNKQIGIILKIPSSLVICLFINFVSQSAFQAWAIYKRYVYEYRMLIVATLIVSVGSSLVSIISVVFICRTAFSRAVSISIVTAIVAAAIYSSVFKSEKVFYNKEVWLFAITFSVPLLPHYLSEFVLQSSDKLMINYLCSSSDVALYSIAYAVGSIINLFTNSVNATFSPYLYQKIKEGEYSKLVTRANQVLIFIGTILAGIMMFSREIVLVFGGTKYVESAAVIVPICLGVFFNYLFSFFGQIQQYFEKKIAIIIPSIMCAVLNIGLNYVFIKIYGYQAAAYTTFLCYFIFFVLNYFLYLRTCKEVLGTKIYDGRSIFIICLAIIATGGIITILNQFIYLKYAILTILLFIGIIKRRSVIGFIKQVVGK